MENTSNFIVFYSDGNLIVTAQKIATTFLESLAKKINDSFILRLQYDFKLKKIINIERQVKSDEYDHLKYEKYEKLLHDIWLDLLNKNKKKTKLTILYRNPVDKFISSLVTDFFVNNFFKFIFVETDGIRGEEFYINPFVIDSISNNFNDMDELTIKNFFLLLKDNRETLFNDMSSIETMDSNLLLLLHSIKKNKNYYKIFSLIINNILENYIIKNSIIREGHNAPYMIHAYCLSNVVKNCNLFNIDIHNLLDYLIKRMNIDYMNPEHLEYNNKKIFTSIIREIIDDNMKIHNLFDQMLYEDKFIYNQFNMINESNPSHEQ